jgi:hypothetical protein
MTKVTGKYKLSSLLRKGWLSLVLFIVAGASLALGAYYQSRPAWSDRPDISEYNAGVMSYYTLSTAVQTESTGTSQAHFAKARAAATDKKLLSLSAYNLGTLMGMDAARTLFQEAAPQPMAPQPMAPQPMLHAISSQVNDRSSPADAQAKLGQAIAQLTDAIRNDPSNEDAKFNLELLQKLLAKAPSQSGNDSSHGYNPGQSNKGY